MADNATLMDLARRKDPNGAIAKIVELMEQQNEILSDMQFQEGNLPTGHRTTERTGLPTVEWRIINQGVSPSKSQTRQIDNACAMLEGYSVIDKRLVVLNGWSATWRATEDITFLEAMNQKLTSALIYGDTSINPKEFTGLSPRLSIPSEDEDTIGYNLIDGGGSGSVNTSIWLVGWGPLTIHGIFPKGTKAGFEHQDLGEKTEIDSAGRRFQAMVSHYTWDVGLVVRDWRYLVRICNIDVSTLVKDAASGADLINLMVQAVELLPSLGIVRPAFYVRGKIRSFLRRQMTNKANVNLSLDDFAGKKVLAFDGIPVRKVRKVLLTEGTIAGTFAHDDA